MTFDDFIEHFGEINVAHVNKTSFLALNQDGSSSIDMQWGLKQYFGTWKEGFNSGYDDAALYENNTQYYLKVDSVAENSCLVRALMQP